MAKTWQHGDKVNGWREAANVLKKQNKPAKKSKPEKKDK